MRSLWKLWVATESEEKAIRVFDVVRGKLGGEVLNRRAEPYPKTEGLLIRFEMEFGAEAWNDGIVQVIATAQRIGRMWILTGDIRQDPSGWSNEPSVPGVQALEWSLATLSPAHDMPWR